MKNMEFKQKLVQLGACESSLEWLGEQDPATAWDAAGAAVHFDWLNWLVRKLPSLNPLWAEYYAKHAPLWAEYNAKRDALLAEYEAKRAPLFYSTFPWSVIERALLKESVSL